MIEVGKFNGPNITKDLTCVPITIYKDEDGTIAVDVFDYGLDQWKASMKGDIVSIEIWHNPKITTFNVDLKEIGRFPHFLHPQLRVISTENTI